jgi:hypothetical protein
VNARARATRATEASTIDAAMGSSDDAKSRDARERTNNFIRIQHSAHIPVGMNFLRDAALEMIPEGDRGAVGDVIRMVRSLFHYGAMEKRDRVKKDFALANVKVGEEKSVGYDGARLNPTAFEAASVDFVGEFCTTMADAEYTLLTQKEWELASAEDFLFTLPVRVDWSCHDKALLKTFLSKNPALAAGLPQFSERALVFKRGTGLAKAKGLFIMQKIEMLLSMLIKEPLLAILGQKQPVFVNANSSDSKKTFGDGKTVEDRNASVIERLTLRRLMPNIFVLFRKLFSTLEIQEPTFKEVVLLYRMARPLDDDAAGPSGCGPLIIKSYVDIPMADLEMIFPEKTVSVKLQEMIQNGIAIVVAIGTLLWAFVTGEIWTKKMQTLLIACAGKLGQSYTAINVARTRYSGMMAKDLIQKSRNAQEGMLMHLLESMEDQEIKEMMLAFVILTVRGKSMTLKEIDIECEDFLRNVFGVDCDFDIEGSMIKLLREGLVEQRAGVLYAATPLKTALALLDNKWDNIFDYNVDAVDGGREDALARYANLHPDTVEASLRDALNSTDKERAKVVNDLKAQNDVLTKEVGELSNSLKGFNWRYS